MQITGEGSIYFASRLINARMRFYEEEGLSGISPFTSMTEAIQPRSVNQDGNTCSPGWDAYKSAIICLNKYPTTNFAVRANVIANNSVRGAFLFASPGKLEASLAVDLRNRKN